MKGNRRFPFSISVLKDYEKSVGIYFNLETARKATSTLELVEYADGEVRYV